MSRALHMLITMCHKKNCTLYNCCSLTSYSYADKMPPKATQDGKSYQVHVHVRMYISECLGSQV